MHSIVVSGAIGYLRIKPTLSIGSVCICRSRHEYSVHCSELVLIHDS